MIERARIQPERRCHAHPGAVARSLGGARRFGRLKDHKPEPVVPRALPPPAPRTDGAIYQAGQEMVLFADLKARRVGDVLTIVLNESTNASKNATTKTSKTSAVTDTGPTIFGRSITTKGVPILDTTLSGSHTFDGEGIELAGQQLRRQPHRDGGRGREQRQSGGAGRQELEAQSGR